MKSSLCLTWSLLVDLSAEGGVDSFPRVVGLDMFLGEDVNRENSCDDRVCIWRWDATCANDEGGLIASCGGGFFLLTPVAEAARATTLILGKSKPEPKIDTPPTAEEEVAVSASSDSQLTNETASIGNVTKLTGVPQIDYIYDPNLPRELNGYNLTDYPFYNSVPEDIDFKCDGLHDGFYASIPHKCQVYHHCLFGTRYDFLCANYTAFDQKTFICHFASEVDCKNSPKYFNRNEALYKAQSTTTLPPAVPAVLTSNARRPQDGQGGRRRRPGNRRRKPVHDYYDDYEDSGEQDYYDDGPPGRKRKRPRPHNREPFESSDEREDEEEKPVPPSGPNKSLYDRPRIAPKIRRPVPINERDKYDYGSDSRAILAKEPVVEKTRYENRESENRKANHRPDYYESTSQGNLKNKESDDERNEREKEHSRDSYESDRERDRDRERTRDRNHGRDEYESDRERSRDKNRDKNRDDFENERERDRDRDRIRDRDRDIDRPYRDRRPPKKRRRPDDDDDYEYEEVRRYRNRNRPRYDEYEDDYDYEDRPYRTRIRDSDYRSREYDYDRDKGYRTRDSDYERPRNRDRNRDDKPIRNREIDSRPERPNRNKDDDRLHRTRDSGDEYYREDDRPGRSKNKPRSESKTDKNSRNRDRDSDRFYSEAESKKSVLKEDYDDESEINSEQKPQRSSNYENKNTQIPDKNARTQERDRNLYEENLRTTDRPQRNRDNTESGVRERPGSETVLEDERRWEEPEVKSTSTRSDRPQFRGRAGTVQKLKITPVESTEEEDGTEKSETNIQPEQSSSVTRKPNGSKRVYFPRPISTTENVVPKRPASVTSEPNIQQAQTSKPVEPSEKPRQDVIRAREQVKILETLPREEPTPNVPTETIATKKKPEVASEMPKFKVPFEEQDLEELAPQAPKYILPSSRRRPFLPSRGGNPNLPRGLLPVGNKALPIPRGFQKTEEVSKGEPKLVSLDVQSKIQPPIEFRAKLTTAIGVQQPKLSSALYEHVDLTDKGQDSDAYYRPEETGQDYRNDYYQDFRPLLINGQKHRTTQDSYQVENSNPVRASFHDAEEESTIVQASSELKDSLQHKPVQITHSKSSFLVNQQLGPQTFYSDNPKFKTTVTVPERFIQKPTMSTLNYHTATHLPIYQAGLQSSYAAEATAENSPKDYALSKGNENHKPLIIKFPSPEKENLDDTDEYDVSLNDALQPISTLHPRNAPTGVFLSQTQRVPHTNGFNRRNHHSQHLYQDQMHNPERHQVLKRVRIETRSAPHQKKTLVQRSEASTIHQRYALPPAVFHGIQSKPPNSNFYAILS